MPNYCHCPNCEESGIYRCLGCNGFHQQWIITKQVKGITVQQESKDD